MLEITLATLGILVTVNVTLTIFFWHLLTNQIERSEARTYEHMNQIARELGRRLDALEKVR